MDTQRFVQMFRLLFTEPACDVKIDWDFPLPNWMVAGIVLYDLLQGYITNVTEMMWIAGQIVIVSRMEFLIIALLLPFVIGKHRTWCRRHEYGFGLAVFFVRVALLFMQLATQLRGLSPECIRTVENIVNRRRAGPA